MSDPYLKGNKAGNRPHYYCFEDTSTGIYWMIPLSSRIEKYRRLIDKKEKEGKPCDILHIVKLDDSRESAFLIQDMFPITEKYIEREYTIAGNHLMLTSEHTAEEIERKARKVMGMLKRGIKFTPTQGCYGDIGEAENLSTYHWSLVFFISNGINLTIVVIYLYEYRKI